ncbi:sensory box histidine kinase [Sphingobium fuliginis]|uniref:Sensory box histidine kinase n=3 Tax=Sphingobium TaxID=165695 RepID=A0A292Z9S7_SPHSA|nr:sensory box histidine kinase [Sphingobium fuliginis]
MLHDLAQPLNVISMANGNLGYIMESLEMPPAQRAQLDERLNRIAAQTEHAASILNLFRWFGRDREGAMLNVKSALQQAVAATRSNVRHGGVGVRLGGDALDYPLAGRHGLLEMMTVAALLSSFGTFVLADGSKIKGLVHVHAELSPSFIVIAIWCEDETARPCPAGPIDQTTLWLLEQIARAGDGDFRRAPEKHGLAQFTIRLARDDI